MDLTYAFPLLGGHRSSNVLYQVHMPDAGVDQHGHLPYFLQGCELSPEIQ